MSSLKRSRVEALRKELWLAQVQEKPRRQLGIWHDQGELFPGQQAG
jgi:hypothetical protein